LLSRCNGPALQQGYQRAPSLPPAARQPPAHPLPPSDPLHCTQVELNKEGGYHSATDLPFTRELGEDSPRASYRRRKDEKKTVLHWGQRESLILAMEFITENYEPGLTIIYCGTASPNTLNYMSTLFEDIKVCLSATQGRAHLQYARTLHTPLFPSRVSFSHARTHNSFFLSDIAGCL